MSLAEWSPYLIGFAVGLSVSSTIESYLWRSLLNVVGEQAKTIESQRVTIDKLLKKDQPR